MTAGGQRGTGPGVTQGPTWPAERLSRAGLSTAVRKLSLPAPPPPPPPAPAPPVGQRERACQVEDANELFRRAADDRRGPAMCAAAPGGQCGGKSRLPRLPLSHKPVCGREGKRNEVRAAWIIGETFMLYFIRDVFVF